MCILRLQHTIDNDIEFTAKLTECLIGIEISAVGDVVRWMFRILLVAENLLAVLEGEEPFKGALVEEEFAQFLRPVVAVDARRDDEADASFGLDKRIRLLQEELVEVDVSGIEAQYLI